MKRISLLVIVALFSCIVAVTVYAQSGGSNAPGVAISQEVFDVEVEVAYSVGDQIVRMKVPAQLSLDATQAISSVVASHSSTVGIFGFEIVDVIETLEEFEYSMFGSFDKPAAGNKLVVVAVDVTNLWSETANLYSLSAEGVDTVGNKYDQDHKSCDDLNPGETGRCLFGFEVAENVELVSVDVSADDHQQFVLPPVSE